MLFGYLETGGSYDCSQPSLRIAPLMANLLIVLAVERVESWHVDYELATGAQPVAKRTEHTHIIRNMLQNIDHEHRIEHLAGTGGLGVYQFHPHVLELSESHLHRGQTWR